MENSIIKLLGESIKSEKVRSFMQQYNLPHNPKIVLDYSGDVFESTPANKKDGIYMTFEGYKRYKYEYGEPDQIVKNPDKDLFLTEITLENDYINTKNPSVIKFSFGLIQGEDYKSVVSKIGRKPNEKGFSSYGKYCWTEFDDYKILTAFDKDSEVLIWIRIKKITITEK